MQGIIWNHEQKLLDNFRQTAKGKTDWFIFFEKSSDKKRFSTRDRGEYCVMSKKGTKVRSAKSEVSMRAWRAPPCVLLCKGLLSWFRKYHKRYFPHNKKDPCDWVRIGCAFAFLIWLCLKQGSIDLGGAQTAQGMCEVQIVWIICTSATPAGTL